MNENEVQKAEQTIVDVLKDKLSSFEMLDVGVGAGRTTGHFVSLVRRYVGVDYSEKMIQACRERFKNVEFKVSDVRALNAFDDGSFDFVLFSYNGLDCIPFEDRAFGIREMLRVLKPRGYLCFSTHNVLSLERFIKFEPCLNPYWFLNLVKRSLRVQRLMTRHRGLHDVSYVMIHDGAENFQSKICYVQPNHQYQQLKEMGIKSISMFSERTGKEIQKEALVNLKEDRWIYFLCQKESG